MYVYIYFKMWIALHANESQVCVDVCVDWGPNMKCGVKYRDTGVKSLKLKEWF